MPRDCKTGGTRSIRNHREARCPGIAKSGPAHRAFNSQLSSTALLDSTPISDAGAVPGVGSDGGSGISWSTRSCHCSLPGGRMRGRLVRCQQKPWDQIRSSTTVTVVLHQLSTGATIRSLLERPRGAPQARARRGGPGARCAGGSPARGRLRYFIHISYFEIFRDIFGCGPARRQPARCGAQRSACVDGRPARTAVRTSRKKTTIMAKKMRK
eukprot:SAG31_NODE_1025_length_10289_cov_3.290677_9_plen_212_part_00